MNDWIFIFNIYIQKHEQNETINMLDLVSHGTETARKHTLDKDYKW